MPIGTAPMDGSRFMANLRIESDGDHPSCDNNVFAYWQASSGRFLIGGGYPLGEGESLTHWMHEPEPPTEGE